MYIYIYIEGTRLGGGVLPLLNKRGLDHSSLGTAQQKLCFFRYIGRWYLSFKVKILEYCDKEDTFTKEQYYIDLLKPKYNIPKVAGLVGELRTCGYTHPDD